MIRRIWFERRERKCISSLLHPDPHLRHRDPAGFPSSSTSQWLHRGGSMLRSTHSRGFSSFWTCLHPILTRSSTSTSLSSRLAARISKSTIETSVLGASTPSSTSTAHRTSRLKSLKDKQHALRALRASQTSGKNKSLDTQLRQLLEKDDVPVRLLLLLHLFSLFALDHRS